MCKRLLCIGKFFGIKYNQLSHVLPEQRTEIIHILSALAIAIACYNHNSQNLAHFVFRGFVMRNSLSYYIVGMSAASGAHSLYVAPEPRAHS